MKLLEIKELAISSVKIIRFARFCDHRGYFTETFRNSQFEEDIDFMKGIDFVQANESFSKKNVVRGLHFQWNPFMGKLVRTVQGRMVDIFLDIRKGSPTFGKCLLHDLPAHYGDESGEWIWVPPGFAHGNYFTEDTTIEYFCSGEYSPGCEAGISPLAGDIDWSLCDGELKKQFDDIIKDGAVLTDKDRDGLSLSDWDGDERSENFIYKEMP